MCVSAYRLVEFNSRVVCGLSVGTFSDLVTTSKPYDDLCRVVVIREAVETGDEYDSLTQDISQW